MARPSRQNRKRKRYEFMAAWIDPECCSLSLSQCVGVNKPCIDFDERGFEANRQATLHTTQVSIPISTSASTLIGII